MPGVTDAEFARDPGPVTADLGHFKTIMDGSALSGLPPDPPAAARLRIDQLIVVRQQLRAEPLAGGADLPQQPDPLAGGREGNPEHVALAERDRRVLPLVAQVQP